MIIRFFAVLALSVATLLPAAFQTSTHAQSQNALAKIDPWVLEHTSGKQEAEFLVILGKQADLDGAQALQTKSEKGNFVYRALYDTAQKTQQPLLDWLSQQSIEHRSYYIINMIWVKGGRDVAVALAARPEVARVDGNPVIHNNLPQPAPFEKEPPVLYTISSGVSYSRAPQVWAAGFTGQGIVVGGADTGYQWDHPALKPHYRGWNGLSANHDYNWHDSIHSGGGGCGANSTQPCDDGSHGSHTMGTAIGDDGGANQIGMAPGAKWIGCRNMDQGNGTPATYVECFQFFLAPYPVNGTPGQGDPAKAPDVTTNSWGCPPSEGCNSTTWLTIQQAIQANRAAGIVTVVAAGNSGPGCSTVSEPPAFFPEVLTVGALSTGTDNIASFSSRGPVTIDGSNRIKPDIAAPGTSIRSSIPVNSYSSNFSGTSMATPHVAGGIALTLSAQPWLRGQAATVETIMEKSAVPITSNLCSSSGVPNNVFGHGRMNAEAAALTGFLPRSAAFGASGADGVLNVSAPSDVSWTATTSDNWILITSGPSGTGNGLVFYSIRDNLAQQARVGTITLASRSYKVRQAGRTTGNCSNTISPSFGSFPSGGGSGTINVASGSGCPWTAIASASWITITSDDGGLAGGSVNYSIAPNTTGAPRKGTIKIGRQLFSVKQQ